jgi:hypothetical protein
VAAALQRSDAGASAHEEHRPRAIRAHDGCHHHVLAVVERGGHSCQGPRTTATTAYVNPQLYMYQSPQRLGLLAPQQQESGVVLALGAEPLHNLYK